MDYFMLPKFYIYPKLIGNFEIIDKKIIISS